MFYKPISYTYQDMVAINNCIIVRDKNLVALHQHQFNFYEGGDKDEIEAKQKFIETNNIPDEYKALPLKNLKKLASMGIFEEEKEEMLAPQENNRDISLPKTK